MGSVHGTMLGLALTMGSLMCAAQDATIPFKQIEQQAQFYASLAAPADVFRESRSSDHSPVMLAEPSTMSFQQMPPAKVTRTFDSKYFLLNGLHLGMAALDVGMTQHCIALHKCREGNPLMPSSFAGQISVDFALVSYGSFASYKLKKHGFKLWWISPVIGTAAHTLGVASGFMHR